jgi:predicted nucleotidyltransferase
MKRSEATERINGVLGRVVSAEGRYLPRVREVWVFGSYARCVGAGTFICRYFLSRDGA